MSQIIIRYFDSRHPYLRNGCHRFVAIDAADAFNIIGSVALESATDEWGWINDLWVDPDCFRRGIGRQLVDEAERVAHDLGVKGTCCGIHPDNKPSRALFESKGYQHVYSYPDTGSLLFSRTFQTGDILRIADTEGSLWA